MSYAGIPLSYTWDLIMQIALELLTIIANDRLENEQETRLDIMCAYVLHCTVGISWNAEANLHHTVQLVCIYIHSW